MQRLDRVRVYITKYDIYKFNSIFNHPIFNIKKYKIRTKYIVAINEYFYYLSNWRVIIYKKCKYVVWLKYVANYLKGVTHRVKYRIIKKI